MATSRRNQAANSQVTNRLETMSLREFCKEKSFISIHNEVRVNKNGYPYVTFIDKNNEAENIYFSINEAKNHKAGDPIVVKDGFFDDLLIGLTKNSDGEERYKLIGQGSSSRESLDDLL